MQVLNIFHVLIAIALVAFILIQKGQGATAGAAFGSGASGTVFGARGAGNFLSRTTWVLALLFCTISLIMAVIVSRTSTVPENDLGIIGSGQSQGQEAPAIESDTGFDDSSEPGVSVGADDSTVSDIPIMDADTGAEDGYGTQSGDAINDLPGDLPDLETGLIEEAVNEETRAVKGGQDGEESRTDGS
jgi:preprotein translocase subunit SecG